MGAQGKLGKLLQKQRLIPAKEDVAVFHVRLQGLHPHSLILRGADALNGQIQALTGGFPGKLLLQEPLELVGLCTEDGVAPAGLPAEQALLFQNVDDDLVRVAALDVRVPDVGKTRVPIHRQRDDGGIVAGGGAAQRGVAIAVKPEVGGAEVHLGGVVVPEPLGGEQTGGGVDGLVLHFRVEGGVPLRQPHEPQIVVAEFFRPEDFGACQHFLAVLEIEGVGGFFPVGVGEVGGEALPVRPQGGGGVGQNGPVFPALEAGVFQQARQKGIVV